MPQVEAPFIIAVIREKEKTLLNTDDITRMLHSSSVHDAKEVLMATPYGIFLTGDDSIQQGLARALEAEFAWLREHLADVDTLAFIAARYDVLHLAQSLIAFANGDAHVPSLSSIGTLSHEMLQELVFTENPSETKETAYWVSVIRAQKDALLEGVWSIPFLMESMKQVLEERLENLASSPFMRSLAAHVRDKHEQDTAFRSNPTDVQAYELEWDTRAGELAKALRYEPIGYDPIIAYWITKEMEVKTLAILFAALAGGFSSEEIRPLIRPVVRV